MTQLEYDFMNKMPRILQNLVEAVNELTEAVKEQNKKMDELLKDE